MTLQELQDVIAMATAYTALCSQQMLIDLETIDNVADDVNTFARHCPDEPEFVEVTLNAEEYE